MKVVHLNYSDSIGGAARAALRIHHAARGAGIDSSLVVNRAALADPTVRVWAQTAPAVRVAISEEFGLPPAFATPGQLVAATLGIWNPYVAERLLQGHWSLLLAYGALPWVAAAVVRLRTGPAERSAWAAVVVLVLPPLFQYV
jgi:hypothetical protein